MTLAVIRATGDLLADVREHCEAYHYLHRWPDARSLPFSYVLLVAGERYTTDGRLNGIVTFKKPQHHRQRGLFGYDGLPTAWQVLDLARVWVQPDLQSHANGHARCIFSQMVSLCLRRVQGDWLIHHPPRFPHLPYHIELIISYCELAHHDGTAYRACSFTSAGKTNDGTKEVYVKWLRRPLKSWAPSRPAQLPLFDGMPLIHSDERITSNDKP